MLQQKINFYPLLSAPSAPTSLLTWERLWISTILIIVLYILIFFYSLWDLHTLKNKKNNLQQQSMLLERKFVRLKATLPASFFSGDLTKTTDELKQQLLAEQKIIDDIKNQGTFSEIYLVFAQIIPKDVWLTTISIIKSGDEILLKGKSLTETNFHAFLSNLSQEPIFKGFAITANKIEKAEKASDTENLTFEISVIKK